MHAVYYKSKRTTRIANSWHICLSQSYKQTYFYKETEEMCELILNRCADSQISAFF